MALRKRKMSGQMSCLAYLFVFVATQAIAQYPFENVIPLSNTEILENELIKKVVEGPLGFVWIATDERMYRFDGTLLKPMFTGNFEDIDIDTAHGQLIFTSRENLIFYNYLGNKTEIISGESLTGGDFHLNSTYILDDSIYWIGSGFGMVQFHYSKGRTRSYPVYAGGDKYAEIRDISRDPLDSGILWLGSKYGLFSFNINSGEYVQHYMEYEERDREIALNDLDCLIAHVDGKIYCGSWGTGLAIFDPETLNYSHFLSELSDRNVSHVYSIVPETDSVLWINSTTSTAKYFPYSGKIESYQYSRIFSHPVMDIGPVMIDMKGRYWIGYTNGLRISDPQKSRIVTIDCPIMNRNMYYIPRKVSYHDDPDLLYLAIDFSEGLYTYDIGKNEWRCITVAGHVAGEQFRAWDSYWQGDTLWILENQRIYFYKKGSIELKEYPFDFSEESYRFRFFARLRNGDIWVISNLRGIYIAKPSENRIVHFSDIDDLAEFEFLNKIRRLHVDGHGRLWLVGKSQLHLYLPLESRFVDLSRQVNNGIPFLDIHNIYEDEKGLWLATMTGVYLIQVVGDDKIVASRVSHVTSECITSDIHGDLWMTSGNNIHRLSVQNRSVQKFTINDGLPESGRDGFERICRISDDRIFLSARKRFAIFHPDDMLSDAETPIPYIVDVLVDGIEADIDRTDLSISSLYLDPDQNSVTIDFSAISYSSQVNNKFRYKLEGVDEEWASTSTRNISPTYINLKGGDYRFVLQASGIKNNWGQPAVLNIFVGEFLWQRSWFQILMVLSVLTAILLFYQARLNSLRVKSATHRQIVNLEKKALQAQMNPHFVFNAMNSIQHLISNGDEKKAMLYLNKFGKLLRSVLENSDSSFVMLEKELEMLENYIALESLRFEGAFEYDIAVHPSLKYSDLQIPGFILQPIVENAIQHGLLPKKSEGNLKISLSDKGTYVHCTIEDNGVGRNGNSGEDPNNLHKSRGLEILQSRLNLLNPNGLVDMIKIIDLKTKSNTAAGTVVEVKLPIETK